MQAVSAQHPRTPGPGLGYALKKESLSGRARSQMILNSIVSGEGLRRIGVGATPPNPGPGVGVCALKKVKERARPLPNDSEFHCERGGSAPQRCRRNTPEPRARGCGFENTGSSTAPCDAPADTVRAWSCARRLASPSRPLASQSGR